uniref:Uncharacterized protein n=1 Tax=Lotharella oceanica TaxID=641309 RepID=A0A7S2TLK8_9EUKA|mmetsp:Transcript_18174/g.34418  ORF Transcript_18174/g.34418 Transcript_18174/m.34418 type:complete len:246 (+) Transcript_18174:55-792(+)
MAHKRDRDGSLTADRTKKNDENTLAVLESNTAESGNDSHSAKRHRTCSENSLNGTEPEEKLNIAPADTWKPVFAVGTRLQVQWEIVDDAEGGTGEVSARWWGCEFFGLKGQDPAGRDIHVIRYDAHGEFEETDSEIVFLSDSDLWDVAYESRLHWRREPPEWNPNQEEKLTMIDVIANQEKEETRNGVPAGLLHSLALNAFSKMPHEKQMAMAARYRDFSNAFKEGLAELKASRCIASKLQVLMI